MSNWKLNISPTVRFKVWLRDRVYQRLFYNPVQDYRRRHGFADRDLFKHVIIQTNYKCTRKCEFCHYGLKNPPENINMEEVLFYSIIDQLKEIGYRGRTGLFEINEPLTDKRIVKFIKYTRATLPTEWIFISSNGDLLNKEKAEQLFVSGLNYIYLSSYDQKALNRHITLLQSLSPENRRRIHHLNRTYQTEWSNRGGNIVQYNTNITRNTPCDFVYEILYIKPDGRIFSCYNDFHGVNEMGNLHDDNLLNIWFSPKFVSLRRQLDAKNRKGNPLCRECDHIGYADLPQIPIGWRLKQLLGGVCE